jgi:hypothetical protein
MEIEVFADGMVSQTFYSRDHTRRIGACVASNDEALLQMFDDCGRTRIAIGTNNDGSAAQVFLDKKGQSVLSLP